MKMKKALVLLIAVLLVGAFIGMAESTVLHPDSITYETNGSISTLDPAWAYDGYSMGVLWQVYGSLIQYDRGSVKSFLPMLSTNVPNLEDNTILDNGTTYVFHMRKGVYFHNGDILTPQDVVYSLERAIIFSRSGGPSWMLSEPLLPKINGSYVDSITQWAAKLAGVKKFDDLFLKGTKTPKNDKYKQALIDTFKLVSKAFEVKGNDVIIHLPHPYPPFLLILAHGASWSSIIDQKWAMANGSWPGTANTWWKYHNPVREKDPLFSIENGTGPFVLKQLIRGREVILERFDKYWAGSAKIKYAIIKNVQEFTTRKLDLLRGNADIIDVPRQYLEQVENVSEVKVIKNLPRLSIYDLAFTWNINPKGNPYIGSGKLDGNGIPPDLFSNLDVRLAFEYLFPYKEYIKQVWLNQAITPNGAIPKGMLGYDSNVPPTYHQDLAKAKYYFKKAYGGELWKKGFKFTAIYISGYQGQTALQMIKRYAREINPKFEIMVRGELVSSFLDDYVTEKFPLYLQEWGADYPDPYDFVQPYYSSIGAWGSAMGKNYLKFAKKEIDPLLVKSMNTVDPKERAKIYKQMNVTTHDNAVFIWITEPYGIEVQRSWVKGYYFNPMMHTVDFYYLSK